MFERPLAVNQRCQGQTVDKSHNYVIILKLNAIVGILGAWGGAPCGGVWWCALFASSRSKCHEHPVFSTSVT